MNAKTLVQTLKYRCNFNILDIANNLGVSKTTVYDWIKGSEPLDNEIYNILQKLIAKKSSNFKDLINHTENILNKTNKIKKENWKNLILGLQERLDLRQFELLEKSNLKKDFHISDWISGKRIPSLYKKFKLVDLCTELNLNVNELIAFGRDIRNSIKVDNVWISTKKIVKPKNNNVLIKLKGKKVLNSISLFPYYKGKHPIKFIPKNNKLIVFYNEKRSTRPQPLIMPKFIDLNHNFLVGLGIYLGEGSRNRKPKVTNSEPRIINRAINFFELFGIKKIRLKAWIQLHERSPKNFNEVKEFWLRNTLLEKENITKLVIKKSSGNAKVKDYGVVHLEANFILLQFLITKLIDLIPPIMEDASRIQIISFLQGAFAGEGSVGLAKSGSLNEIRYTSVREDERKLIKSLLGELGVVVHEYKKGFDLKVHGYKNLKKLVEISLFKFHPLRDEKMNIGFEKLSRKFI